MSRKISKPVAIALGSAFIGGLAATGPVVAATANDNPFSMEQLHAGQTVADNHDADSDSGEGSCGEDKKDGEGSCGEGKCGGGIA